MRYETSESDMRWHTKAKLGTGIIHKAFSGETFPARSSKIVSNPVARLRSVITSLGRGSASLVMLHALRVLSGVVLTAIKDFMNCCMIPMI
jgi:hypothetical protein